MTIDRRAVAAALPVLLFLAGSLQADPKHKHKAHGHKHGWDGKWSGKWGDQDSEATSITIVNNKVVSYDYHGATTPVSAPSTVTPTTFSYQTNGVSVVLKRTGAKTATASLHSPQGEATAQLTRQ